MTAQKILIVDDNVAAGTVLADYFSIKGYLAQTAVCGLDALALLKDNKYAAAIIDINLPDTNGIKLLGKIKTENPQMVCAIITGSASLQNAVDALQEKADGFFVKPAVLGKVYLHIKSAIAKKSLERDLHLSLKLPHTILNSVDDSISIIDAKDYSIKMVNKVFLDEVAIPEAEIIGQPCYRIIYQQESPCDNRLHECPIQQTLKTGDHVRQEMLRPINGGEEEKYMEISASPIFDKEGDIIQVVHVSRDITERKKLELSLTAEKSNLEKINTELSDAYHELKSTQAKVIQQEKMASIGSLAAGVAHEINNPMGFISSNLSTLGKYAQKFSNYIELQQHCLAEAADEEKLAEIKQQRKKLKIDYLLEDISDLIEESLEGADRVKTIVQNLKSFARVDDQKPISTNLNDCLISTLNIVWNELKYKATVNKEYGDIPQVRCFPQQINQVFMNLLINAAHAIEDQGEITIKTESKNGQVLVHISDTGCGIPKENIAKIFEPFFTTKEVGKGTGLGMSIAYDIIKKHDGDIQLQTEVGRGTCFTVSLPAEVDSEDNINS